MDRKEALLYEELPGKRVMCTLCGHNCYIADSGVGVCRVRQNIDGKLYSLNFGKICALAVDPIEKKPLYHFFPGSKTLSVAAQGCNFKCQFCQNYGISQVDKPEDISGENLMPEDIIKIAKAKNSKIISYTYSEPTVFYEFMLETAMLAKSVGIKNVMVTNGFMSKEALTELLRFIDAFNVDLKSFRAPTYTDVIGGKLEIVLSNLFEISRSKAWLEVTTLLVTDLNTSNDEIEDIAGYVANLSAFVPWHISAYHPDYKMADKNNPTSAEILKKAYSIGLKNGLKYVYVGNAQDEAATTTFCPRCKEEVYRRRGYFIERVNNPLGNLKNKCGKCGYEIEGVF
jgi:pyruvate formate lyase activating enzyme